MVKSPHPHKAKHFVSMILRAVSTVFATPVKMAEYDSKTREYVFRDRKYDFLDDFMCLHQLPIFEA